MKAANKYCRHNMPDYSYYSHIRCDSRAFKYFLFLPIGYKDGAMYRKSINEYMSKDRYSKVGTIFLEAYKKEQRYIIQLEKNNSVEKELAPIEDKPTDMEVPKKIRFFAHYIDFVHKIWPKSLTQKMLYFIFLPVGVIWFLVGFMPIFIGSYCYKIYHKVTAENKRKYYANDNLNKYIKSWKGTFFKEIWDAFKALLRLNSKFSDKKIDYWYSNDKYRKFLGDETLVIDKVIEAQIKQELKELEEIKEFERNSTEKIDESKFMVLTEDDVNPKELAKDTITFEDACDRLGKSGAKIDNLKHEVIINYWNQLQSANFRVINNKFATFADPHGTASKELIPIIKILFPNLPIAGIQGVKINLQVKEKRTGFCNHAEVLLILPEKKIMYIIEPKSTNTIAPDDPLEFSNSEIIELGLQNNYLSTSCVTFSSAIMLVLSQLLCADKHEIGYLKERLYKLKLFDLLEYMETNCLQS
jgi:hypothetical protein